MKLSKFLGVSLIIVCLASVAKSDDILKLSVESDKKVKWNYISENNIFESTSTLNEYRKNELGF